MTLLEKVRKAKHVFLIGNGGSYANASHIANDLLACGIRAFTLDAACLTASANDHGYENVFSRWISTVGEQGDLLIALSGSGTSKNITKALAVARSMDMDTHLVTDYLQSMDMQASEEAQLRIGHDLLRKLKK